MNSSAVTVALVPYEVVTKTLCNAATWAGETAVISVAETTVKLPARTVPKMTLVAPEKPVPVIVTVVPPDVGPELGDTAATAGAAT